jgi:hypothetical protein
MGCKAVTLNTRANFKSTPLYAKGHNGELLVADKLMQLGYFVVPSYDYSGQENDKAPKMKGLMRSFVLPDLDVSKSGSRKWVEVKTKEDATYTRITQQYEHGIPLRHYRQYLEVEKESGCAVYLAVYEIKTGEVLIGRLSELSKLVRIYDGDKMSRGGMAFFPRSAFRLLFRL